MMFFTFLITQDVFSQQANSSQAAQQSVVRGRVIDANNEPLVGALVVERGTSNGVITLADGTFSLPLSQDGTQKVIVITFLGMTPREVNVNVAATDLGDLVLTGESSMLEEVVVVAYGVQKKETLTGALSTIGTAELLKAPVPNLGNSLAGNLRGLSSIQYSGQPGADDPTIFIRGQGSLDAARSAPLFLVDGVERSFFRLDPNEVESISILKDASSTAVFGVRGANGVILVTTRRGQIGTPKISLTTSAGIQSPLRKPEFADSYNYGLMFNEAQRNDGTRPEDLTFPEARLEAFRTQSDPLLYPNTDWMGMFLKPAALQTQHNLNVTGGTESVRYFVSLGVLTQDGIFKSFDTAYNGNWTYNKYNYRANLDIDVTPTTLLKVNLGGRSELRHEPVQNNNNFWLNMHYALPFAGVGLYEGKWVRSHTDNVGMTEGTLENGDMFEQIYGKGYRDYLLNTIELDVQLEQKLDVITKGLSFNLKGSYNNGFTHQKDRIKGEAYYTAHREAGVNNGEIFFRKRRDPSNMNFSESRTHTRDWYLEGNLSYARSFGKHNVTALALYQQSRIQYRKPDENLPYPDIPRGYVGLVGRVTYDFNRRYMAEFNVGYNGSENFAPGHRYGLFPAVSAGWIVSEESFMDGIGFIDYLKLRASYGSVGNDKYSGSRFFYLPDAYNANSGGINFGTNITTNQPIATELRKGNPDVSWEVARKQNYGIDFAFFGEKLSGGFDYFIEKRDGILISRQTVPAHVAISMPVMNLGKTENRGFELELSWDHKVGDFQYHIGGNVTLAKSKVIYKDEIPRNYPWRYETGRPVDQQFGYTFDGFATEQYLASDHPDHKVVLKPGDATYKDLNGDNIIDDNDISAIGYSRFPELSGGFTLGFDWKGLDFSMMWAGVARVSRYLTDFYRIPFGMTGNRGIYTWMIEERWTPETAGTATAPRLSFDQTVNNYRDSSLWLKDGSYLRLKNLQVGYTIREKNWLGKVGISSLRVYATGENLLTLDHIKFYDPEARDGATYRYPMVMIMTLGLNINF